MRESPGRAPGLVHAPPQLQRCHGTILGKPDIGTIRGAAQWDDRRFRPAPHPLNEEPILDLPATALHGLDQPVVEGATQVARGYFVTAYALAEGDLEVAYFKVAAEPSASYFDVEACIFKGTATADRSAGDSALERAFEHAGRLFRVMPEARAVARQLNGRCLTNLGLHVYKSLPSPQDFDGYMVL